MTGHELLTDYFCKDFRGGWMLNEERGRIPFIERILDELVEYLGINKQKPILLENVSYKPNFGTFFNSITFMEVKINIIPINTTEKDSANAYFDSDYATRNNGKLEDIPIYIEINSRKSNLLYNFRRIMAHELLHAYEFYKKGIIGKPLQSEQESLFYNWIQEVISKRERNDYYAFAYLFYMTEQKEIRAFSQAIQEGYNQLRGQFGLNYAVLPFQYCYKKIKEFNILKVAKKNVKNVLENESDDEIIAAMSYVSRTRFTSVRQVKRKIKALLFKVEQAFDKALSRAIEDFAIRANRCTYAHIDPDVQFDNWKKLKDIYREYGDAQFKDIYGKL